MRVVVIFLQVIIQRIILKVLDHQLKRVLICSLTLTLSLHSHKFLSLASLSLIFLKMRKRITSLSQFFFKINYQNERTSLLKKYLHRLLKIQILLLSKVQQMHLGRRKFRFLRLQVLREGKIQLTMKNQRGRKNMQVEEQKKKYLLREKK